MAGFRTPNAGSGGGGSRGKKPTKQRIGLDPAICAEVRAAAALSVEEPGAAADDPWARGEWSPAVQEFAARYALSEPLA